MEIGGGHCSVRVWGCPQRWVHSNLVVGPGEGLGSLGDVSRCALCPFQRLHDRSVKGCKDLPLGGKSSWRKSDCDREYRGGYALSWGKGRRCGIQTGIN